MSLKPEQQLRAIEVLKNLTLFAGCSLESLQSLAAKLDAREFLKGKVIMMDQEINKTLYILAKGSVGVWKRIQNEKKRLVLLEAPTVFGERSMFEESPASAMIKAETDCSTYLLDRSHFSEVAKQFADMATQVQKNMEIVRALRGAPPTSPSPS
ncbi:MAG: cyclic nucleotide-binding domain-containing protein [Elusimicrobiota bacterium]